MATKHQASGLQGFELSIDRDAEIPIGVQLAWALRARIHDGRFKPGQRLPGLRELAAATGMNINTVRAVYQRLDQEGLIESQQGSGTFVGPTPRRQSDVATIVATAVREARETGVDPREVAAALYVSPEPQPTDTGAERRRLLRTQIAAFERALGDIEAEHPGVISSPIGGRGSLGPTLLATQELEQVRTQLVRRLATVQAAIDELAQASDADSSPGAPQKAPTRKVAKKPKRTPRPRTRTRPAPASG